MKKTLLVLAAVGALALSSCSSDATSDTTPGDDNPNPQVTDDNPDNNLNPADTPFCQMIANSEELDNDLTAAQDALDALADDQANWDSPETVAALHTQGQAMLDFADDIATIYDRAAAEAGDPEVSAAFTTLSDYIEMMFLALGQSALEADSYMDYIMNMGTYLDQEAITAMTEDLTDAGPIITEYIYETCGYSGMDD